MTNPSDPQRSPPRHRMIYRHAVLVRLTHWINFGCMVILLMSGLAIFNGWPALYWGQRSDFDAPLLALYATQDPASQDSAGKQIGITQILGHRFATTGWLGLSPGADGAPVVRGFPRWATIPGPLWLAMARHWHFFFAWIFVLNGFAYAAYALFGRHLWRDLVPSRQQIRHIGRSAWDHVRLRFPKGEQARHYNVLQKLSYLAVMFGMAPLMLATGLAMSPWIDAAWPLLPDVFGGRQSARTIHFVTAFGLVAFVLIHVLMVLLSGPWNNMRSMTTGWFRIEETTRGQGDDNDRRTAAD